MSLSAACWILLAKPALGPVSIPHATVRLVASNQATGRGSKAAFVVEFAPDPGWHTYYSNPGEAGVATLSKWTLPKGWRVAQEEFPTPSRHVEAGTTTFVYEQKTRFVLTLEAGPTAVSGKFGLEAKFFVCKAECTIGTARFKGSLKVGQASREDRSGVDLLKAARKALPQVTGLSSKVIPHANELQLVLPNPEGATPIDFICADPGVVAEGHPRFETRTAPNNLVAYLIRSEYSNAVPPRVRGILSLKSRSGLIQHFWIDAPVTDYMPCQAPIRKKP